MALLDEIIRKKKESLLRAKAKISFSEIKARVAEAQSPFDFKKAITRDGDIKLIAEIKKASPSKGLIRADLDPQKIARVYGEKAHAVSVLTEENFFQGSLLYIAVAKKASKRPILRKDFIFDEYQIYESKAAGADAILLIARALSEAQAVEFLAMARELGMAVLFEVHDFKELETALKIDAPIIGINNRDLDTLTIDLARTFELKREIPPERVVVSESGIEGRKDVLRMAECGVDAILVGTAIMKEKDIAKKINELIGLGNGKG
jgi:indole-3-glycerol phosphate synthase